MVTMENGKIFVPVSSRTQIPWSSSLTLATVLTQLSEFPKYVRKLHKNGDWQINTLNNS
jgi:hypothetical protein